MKWYKKYFENRRYFECPECGQYFSLSFWEWLCAPHFDNWRYRYVRCPYCKRRHWLKAIEGNKMTNQYVICGAEMPEGGHICIKCMDGAAQPKCFTQVIAPPKPNTELSFGASDGQYDFLVCYRRAKPLNRFQIWMYKVCFGIRARNI